MSDPDWYERRNELREDQVFRDFEGDLVKLDRRVPGDGSRWYAAVLCGRSWSYEDYEVEPTDLRDEPIEDPAPMQAA